MTKKPLSQYHPALFYLSVFYRRLKRHIILAKCRTSWAKDQINHKLPVLVKTHQSTLIRPLSGTDIQLQKNKVVNLKIAVQHLDGLIIKPGEIFSFYKCIGWPTRLKGYIKGLELSAGETKAGIGGGLCQIANMIHWLVLHSDLDVIEHHHHSFDLFPDQDRVVPFGCGATLFYNYLDYQVQNNTDQTYQFRLTVTDDCLLGELAADKPVPYTYHIIEKNHKFVHKDGKTYRQNEIWREKHYNAELIGNSDSELTLLKKNNSLVLYPVGNIME